MRVAWLLLLAGCGRIGFAEQDPRIDAAGPGDGGTGSFTALAMPPGGLAMSLAVTGSLARYYVGYAGGRIFRVDSGVWTECAPLPGDPWDMSVAPDGTLYANSSYSVARSTDACATFTLLDPPAGAQSVAATSTALYAGTWDGVYQWTATSGWSQMSSPFNGVSVNGITTDGTRIGVAADGLIGVYRNSAWSTTAVTGARGYRVTFDPVDSTRVWAAVEDGLYLSTNSGTAFTSSYPMYVDLFAMDPGNRQHMLAMTGGALEESLDGGATWSGEKRNAAVANSWPLALAFDPMGSGAAVMATEAGTFSAPTSALAWTRIDTVDAWDVQQVIENQSVLYVATSGGLWTSESVGSWSLRGAKIGVSSAVYVAHVAAADPTRVFAGGDALGGSSNRGIDFTTLLPASQTDGWMFLSMAERGGRLFSGSWARLTYSDDGGTTWTAANMGGSHLIQGIAARAAGLEVVVATDTGVYWSLDNGATFTASSTGLADPDLRGPIVELADGRIAVGAQDGLWTAAGNGATWMRAGFAGKRVYALLSTSTALFAAVGDGVFVSKDGAATWTEVPGLASRWPRTLSLGAGNTLLVGTQGHGLYRTTLP